MRYSFRDTVSGAQSSNDRWRLRTLLALLCTTLASATLAEVRSMDGSGNNQENNRLGAVDTQLLRKAPADYTADGSTPLRNYPNPREISNIVVAQPRSLPNSIGATSMMFIWGQFLDHDLDLTEAADPPEYFPVVVLDPDDPLYPEIPLFRSKHEGGTYEQGPRQQLNQITTWIDASNVYGSDTERANFLRTNDGWGRLKTSKHDLLPYNTAGLHNAGGSDPGLYIAGDIRANEHVGLAAMHTLFVREHNRLADEFARANKDWSDEEIYQAARAWVGALMQVITYKEFLPILIGDELPAYTGYKNTIDPSIANVFSTACFRFGHSMVPSTLWRLKSNGKSIPKGDLSLAEAFFTRGELDPDVGKGIEPLLRGFGQQIAQDVDPFIVTELRNFLFGSPGAEGVDLASLNIQRGRDHGLPDYNTVREAYELEPKQAFSDISSNVEVQERLQSVYGSVDDIDPWVGCLAEDPKDNALVGELLQEVLKDQFTRLRDGDRFWYQNVFSGDELAELQETRLADVIVRNTKIKAKELGKSAFLAD